jgi:prepilin peptidase CpaA
MVPPLPPPGSIDLALLCAAALLLGLAALFDLGYRLIPDALPAGLAGLALAVRLAEGWHPALLGLIAAACMFVVLGALSVRGLLGGGDVKLAAATALFLPTRAVDDFVLATALAGGVLALGYLILGFALRRLGAHRPRPPSLLGRLARTEGWRIRRGGPLPYGVAIAVGAVAALSRPDHFASLL